MQNIRDLSSDEGATLAEGFSIRQRLLSASLSLTMTGSATVLGALANGPAHLPVPQAGASASPGLPPHSGFHSSGPLGAASFAAAAASANGLHSTGAASFSSFAHGKSHMPTPMPFLPATVTRNVVQSAVNQAVAKYDLNLYNATPLFSASGLAGFNTLTLVVGGKQETFNVGSKLTASELIAAQQVLSGGKQEITLNSRGVATGGSFDLNQTTMAALNGAVGGAVGSMVISHGVKAVDTMGNLNLSGSLINLGSIVVGAAPGAKGQSVDTISAANIFNASRATIASAPVSSNPNAVQPTGISLIADGTFYNSGTVSSSGVLNIQAATVNNVVELGAHGAPGAVPVLKAVDNVNINTNTLNNSGLIASVNSNVNIASIGSTSNLMVNGAGGTVQATKGDINFNNAGYAGIGNITVAGGDYLSKTVNFNDTAGKIDATMDDVSGVINADANCAHIIASTDNMHLGNMNITGDPIYYNQNGNIVIDGNISTTNSGEDLILVASGNIVSDGGKLVTKSTTGDAGDLVLIAGANITSVSGVSGSATSVTISDSTLATKGSKTGGFIDLSGVNLSPTKTKAIAAIDTSSTVGKAGDVTMVAYSGSGKNTGTVVATNLNNPSLDPGSIIMAKGLTGDGTVNLMSDGFIIFAEAVNAGTLNMTGAIPTIGGSLVIQDGTPVQIPAGKTTNTIIETGSLLLSGALNCNTGGNVLLLAPVNAGGPLTINTGASVNLASAVHATSAKITAAGAVEGFYLSTAGAAGVSGGAAQNAGNGGQIDITAGTIALNYIDSSGGGGAGGSTANGVGGNGGNGGNINLKSTVGDIFVYGYVNASGGAGGGGAGANAGDTVTVNAGGTGGKASTISIDAAKSFTATQVVGFAVLDFDGAAGGKGGAATATVAGGGGGGGAGFGGGGGGGAAGTAAVGLNGNVGGGGGGAWTLLGGGGGGAGTTAGTLSATGGGGGASIGTGGQPSTGGAKGTATPVGTSGGPGVGGFTGKSPNNGTGGFGGGFVANPSGGPSTTGGDPGGMDGAGTGGGGPLAATSGAKGGATTLIGGTGHIDFKVGGNVGAPNNFIALDSTTLTVTGTAKAALYIASGGEIMDLKSATLVAGSTLSLFESHQSITIDGPITGAAVIQAQGAGGVIVNSPLTASKEIDLGAGQNVIQTSQGTIGAIVGSITSNSKLTAPTITLLGRVEGGAGGNIGTPGSPIEVSTNAISVSGGNVSLLVDTTPGQTTKFGTALSQKSDALGGVFNLTLTGGGSLVTSTPITAPVSVNITDNGGFVGTASKPVLTNTAALNVSTAVASTIYLSDSNTGTLAFAGGDTTTIGSSISLVSAANTLNVNNLNFVNVTINSTSKAAGTVVNLDAAAATKIGQGLGVVSVTAVGDINQGSGDGIFASAVVLNSTGGSIGAGANKALKVDSQIVSAKAAKGSVLILDSSSGAVDLQAGTALKTYQITANGINVNGALSAGTVNLVNLNGFVPVALNAAVGGTKTSDITIDSDGGILQNGKAVLTANNVTLKSSASQIGANNQYIMVKASNLLAITGAASQSVWVNENGKAALTTSSGGANSNLFLIDSSPLSIAGVVSFDNIEITAPSVSIAVGAGTAGSALKLITPVLTIASGGSISATTAVIRSAGALSISGAGTISNVVALQLGGVVNGKTTSSITLGDAKTGANDPVGNLLKSGATVSNLTVSTTGKFTTGLNAISVVPTGSGDGGTINFNAGNYVVVGSAPTQISISADGSAAHNDGNIIFKLNGSQDMQIGGKAGKLVPYFFSVDLNGGGGGQVNVSDGGNLTVNGDGLKANGGTLILSAGKNLAVVDDVFAAGNKITTATVSSGSKSPFVVDSGLGAGTVNGTAFAINGDIVNVFAGGPITINDSGIVAKTATSVNNLNGTLIVTGSSNLSNGIVTGPQLVLTGKTGIILGDAKTGQGNPFENVIKSSSLQYLDIEAGTGNFSSDISSFVLDPNNASASQPNFLKVVAANIVVAGGPVNPIITLKTDTTAGTAGFLLLTLSGTQAVTLDAKASLSAKGPTYLISNQGTGVSPFTLQTTVSAAGILTVNAGGLVSADNTSVGLSGGKGLMVSDANLLAGANLAEVKLSSGAGSPLTIGSKTGTNYVAGDIKAGAVTITDLKGILIAAPATVQASSTVGGLNLYTSNLDVAGTIVGGGAGSVLTIASDTLPGKNSLSVTFLPGGTVTATTFSNLNIRSTGGINFEGAFTSDNTLNNTGNVSIHAPGTVTFDALAPGLSVANNGVLSITAGAVASKANGPITFSENSTTSASININLTGTGAVTLGTAKGNINIDTPGAGTNIVQFVSGGKVAVDKMPFNLTGLTLAGASVTVDSVLNVGNMSVFATSKSGSIVTAAGAFLQSNILTLGTANPSLSKTAIEVVANTVILGGISPTGGAILNGALNIHNKNVVGAQVERSNSIAALNYSGDGATLVKSVTTTNGGINVTSLGGLTVGTGEILSTISGGINLVAAGTTVDLTVQDNAVLLTNGGSITLQNNSTAPTGAKIDIGKSVNMHASATAAGVGQVSLVFGAVPSSKNLVTGVVPAASTPTIIQTGGATVTFGTTTNPNGTVTTGTGVVLNAAGRNVVFNDGGAGGSINVQDNTTITGDPPIVIGSPNHSASIAPVVFADTAPSRSAQTIEAGAIAAPSSLYGSASTTSTFSAGAIPGVVTSGAISSGAISSGASTLVPTAISTAIGQLSISPVALQTASLNSANSSISSAALPGLTGLAATGERQGEVAPTLQGEISQLHRAEKKSSRSVPTAVTEVRHLDAGPLFLSPEHNTRVQTRFGSVDVSAHAAVLVVAFSEGVAVYDLHDMKRDSVVVRAGEHRVALSPGRSAVLTRRAVGYFEQANPCDFVAYRRISSRNFDDGMQLLQSEFNTLTLINGLAPLKTMLASQDPSHKKTCAAMLKTAAILLSVDGTPYEFMPKSRLAKMAMAQ